MNGPPEPEARGATAHGSRGKAASGAALAALGRFARVILRQGPLALAVLLAGVTAGALLIAVEFTTFRSIRVITACDEIAAPEQRDLCSITGGEQHSYALLLLGLLVVAFILAAVLVPSRPPAAGVAVVGVVVLLIALLADRPDVTATGLIGEAFSDAEARPGIGFWLEIAGGALAVATGSFWLSRRT